MRLIYYIGQEKTGSSSLQHFLAQNSLSLIRKGLLYPSVEGTGLAHFISKALSGRDDRQNLSLLQQMPHNALAHKMVAEHASKFEVPQHFRPLPPSDVLLRNISAQIDQLSPKAVLMVSEVFCHLARHAPKTIDRLADWSKPADDVQIYCSIRKPDDLIVSWYGQSLRFPGLHIKPLSDAGLEQILRAKYLRLDQILDAWKGAFPKAKFLVHPYDDLKAHGGSIGHFFRQTGLSIPRGALPEAAQNPSLPYAMLALAWQAKRALPKGEFPRFLEGLIDLSRVSTDIPSNGQIEMFGDENRARLVAHFTPVHARVSELTGRNPFFEDLSSLSTKREMPEIDAANIALQALPIPKPDKRFTANGVAFLRDMKKTGIELG